MKASSPDCPHLEVRRPDPCVQGSAGMLNSATADLFALEVTSISNNVELIRLNGFFGLPR